MCLQRLSDHRQHRCYMKRLLVLMVCALAFAAPALAVNNVEVVIGTEQCWSDGEANCNSGSREEELDLGALAADGVRVGSYHDWGADPRTTRYGWCMDIDGFDTAPVVGESVDLYAAVSEDLTPWTGPEAPADTTDGAGDENRLKNLTYLGSAVVRSTTAADNLTVCGRVIIPQRYVAPVVHNNTADALLSTSDNHEVIFWPLTDQIQ